MFKLSFTQMGWTRAMRNVEAVAVECSGVLYLLAENEGELQVVRSEGSEHEIVYSEFLAAEAGVS